MNKKLFLAPLLFLVGCASTNPPPNNAPPVSTVYLDTPHPEYITYSQGDWEITLPTTFNPHRIELRKFSAVDTATQTAVMLTDDPTSDVDIPRLTAYILMQGGVEDLHVSKLAGQDGMFFQIRNDGRRILVWIAEYGSHLHQFVCGGLEQDSDVTSRCAGLATNVKFKEQ